jgi:DNA-binding NarL/FixJ family response regulator
MEKKPVSVVLADDTLIAREGWKIILSTSKDIQVIGEAENIPDVVRKVRELSPDVLLMDLRWFGDETAGWSTIRTIKSSQPQIRVIAITAYENLIKDARRAGADAALTKTFSRDELLEQIREVMAQKANLPKDPTDAWENEALTPREMEALELVKQGYKDKEIAEILSIAESTAKNHVKSVIAKLGAKNRTHAVSLARERGIII